VQRTWDDAAKVVTFMPLKDKSASAEGWSVPFVMGLRNTDGPAYSQV
jgi:hypothetical protein